MRAAISVDDRVLRVISHPARAEQMSRAISRPGVLAPGCFENLFHLGDCVSDDALVVIVVAEKDVRDGQAVLVSLRPVQLNHIILLREDFADDTDARVVIVIEHRTPEFCAPQPSRCGDARRKIHGVRPNPLYRVTSDEIRIRHRAIEVFGERESGRGFVLIDPVRKLGEDLMA